MSKAFLDAVKNRRSYYPLKKESPISNTRIQEIVNEVVLHVPSSFNAQSTRVVLLLGAEHEKLWDITHEVLEAIVPAEHFASTGQKLQMFKGAYGTALFFVHRPTVQKQQEDYTAYADKFPHWAEQTAGMSEFTLWTALEAEGLGGNLQHYNPLIDQKVAAQWDLPADWELDAQLVFGTPTGDAGEKSFMPVEERFKTFGA